MHVVLNLGILFEVDGVSEQIAKEALYKASAKLPIKPKQ